MTPKHQPLQEQHCVPCEGGTPPMNAAEANRYRKEINPAWTLVNHAILSRIFSFPSFKAAISFATAVAKIADHENHHPDIHIFYRTVKLDLSTHAIKGLSLNDFILAKKIDLLNNTD